MLSSVAVGVGLRFALVDRMDPMCATARRPATFGENLHRERELGSAPFEDPCGESVGASARMFVEDIQQFKYTTHPQSQKATLLYAPFEIYLGTLVCVI